MPGSAAAGQISGGGGNRSALAGSARLCSKQLVAAAGYFGPEREFGEQMVSHLKSVGQELGKLSVLADEVRRLPSKETDQWPNLASSLDALSGAISGAQRVIRRFGDMLRNELKKRGVEEKDPNYRTARQRNDDLDVLDHLQEEVLANLKGLKSHIEGLLELIDPS
jgi:hypothetical protein